MTRRHDALGDGMAMNPHVDVSGIILAGGRATRMGVDKAAVEVGGIPLLQRAVELVRHVADDLIIVTRDQTGGLLEARMIGDVVQDRGPLGGLLSGLLAATHPSALIIPVDMPLLTMDLLRYLISASAGWEITLPRWKGGMEPLVGVYSTVCTDAMEKFLTHPNPSARDFVRFGDFSVRYVEEFELRQFSDPARLFFNVNTPDDVRTAEVLLQDRLP